MRDLSEDDIDRIMHETTYIPEMFSTPDRDTALREFKVHYLCSIEDQAHPEEAAETTTNITDDGSQSEPLDVAPITETAAPPKQTPTNEVEPSSNGNNNTSKSKEDQELDDILSGVQVPF